MSVSLLITYHDAQKENRLVPIATEKTFQDYWQPASTTLGLQWIPLFQGGIPISTEDIPLVINDLVALKTFLASGAQQNIPLDITHSLIERIDTIIPALQQLQTEKNAEIYIG